VFLGGKVSHNTSFFWFDACCLILESPLGVFPDRAFFIVAWLALLDGHLTIFTAAAPP
jgi:hypothetical protein